MIEKWLQYTCDACGETDTSGDPNATARDVRAIIKEYGWRNVGRLDYCPNCVDRGLDKERATGFDQ